MERAEANLDGMILTRPDRQNSDRIETVYAQARAEKAVAVLIKSGQQTLTYSGNIHGVFIDNNHGFLRIVASNEDFSWTVASFRVDKICFTIIPDYLSRKRRLR